MSIKHATKRVFSRASTRKKTIDKGLDQEFVDSRRRLNNIYTSIKSLTKSILSARQVWTAVAKHNREFSKTLSASFPLSGNVHAHADEVEESLRNVQESLMTDDSKESAHQQIIAVLEKYMEILKSIEGEYKGVETAFTEKQRYERKVNKLGKEGKKPNKPEKINRNLQKMADAQKELDSKLNATLARMRSVFNQHEAVLQCAHHSYWMANDAYLTTIEQATRNIRLESKAIHNRLLSIEVQEDKVLIPVPRVNLIEEFDGCTNRQNSVTMVVDPTVTTSPINSARVSDATNTPIIQTASVHSTPTVQQMPTVTSKNGTDLTMPDPPMTPITPPKVPLTTTTTATTATRVPTTDRAQASIAV